MKTRLFALGFVLSGAMTSGMGIWHTGLHWHDNATNADRPADILSAAQITGELRVNHTRPRTTAGHPRLHAALAVETWPRYDGLDLAHMTAGAEWRLKPSLGAYRPSFAFGFEGGFTAAREAARSGPQGALWARVEQRLSPAWQANLRHTRDRHDARQLAFDRTAHETALSFQRVTASAWVLTLEARHRRGDVVAYLDPEHPVLADKSQTPFKVSTFDRSNRLVAYYFDATTRTGAIRLSREFGPAIRLELAWEQRTTRQGVVPYRNRVTSLELSRRW